PRLPVLRAYCTSQVRHSVRAGPLAFSVYARARARDPREREFAVATKTKSKSTMSADEITPEPLNRNGPPLRLRRNRREAAGLIRNQLKIGQAIRNQRMGSHWDLDQARTEKQEWVQRTSDLLTQLFSDTSVAEQCNEWYGTVLPEYAELE